MKIFFPSNFREKVIKDNKKWHIVTIIYFSEGWIGNKIYSYYCVAESNKNDLEKVSIPKRSV
jgi:hypothetical protein